MTADPALNEAVLWAPHVVMVSPRDWVMFYWSDQLEPEQPKRGLRRADSQDLWNWTRWEKTPDAEQRQSRWPRSLPFCETAIDGCCTPSDVTLPFVDRSW